MMRSLTIVLIAMLLVSPGTHAEDQVDARKELDMFGVPFTADEFVNRAERGDLLIVDLMLDAGMPADTKDKDGMPALIAAVSEKVEASYLGERAIVYEITPWPKGRQSIWLSEVNRGPRNNAVVFALLDRGADPNISDSRGATAIMTAATVGNEAVAKALLDKGADVNAEDTDGETALILVAKHGNGAIVRLLVENGADVNARNTAGASALKIATDNGRTDIVKLLLENGAEPEVEDTTKSTEEPTTSDPEITPLEIRLKALENAVTILKAEDKDKQNKIHALQNQVQKLDAEVAELTRPRGPEFIFNSR